MGTGLLLFVALIGAVIGAFAAIEEELAECEKDDTRS